MCISECQLQLSFAFFSQLQLAILLDNSCSWYPLLFEVNCSWLFCFLDSSCSCYLLFLLVGWVNCCCLTCYFGMVLIQLQLDLRLPFYYIFSCGVSPEFQLQLMLGLSLLANCNWYFETFGIYFKHLAL